MGKLMRLSIAVFFFPAAMQRNGVIMGGGRGGGRWGLRTCEGMCVCVCVPDGWGVGVLVMML